MKYFNKSDLKIINKLIEEKGVDGVISIYKYAEELHNLTSNSALIQDELDVLNSMITNPNQSIDYSICKEDIDRLMIIEDICKNEDFTHYGFIQFENVEDLTCSPLFYNIKNNEVITADIDTKRIDYFFLEDSLIDEEDLKCPRACHHELLTIIFNKQIEYRDSLKYRILFKLLGFVDCFPTKASIQKEYFQFTTVSDFNQQCGSKQEYIQVKMNDHLKAYVEHIEEYEMTLLEEELDEEEYNNI